MEINCQCRIRADSIGMTLQSPSHESRVTIHDSRFTSHESTSLATRSRVYPTKGSVRSPSDVNGTAATHEGLDVRDKASLLPA